MTRLMPVSYTHLDVYKRQVHTLNCGQVSINISKPGVTKGEHWHNTKWEQFIVVSGHGLIQLRKEGTEEVLNYEVSGDKIQSVIMLPGYTHNIINLSDTEDLVTVMYLSLIHIEMGIRDRSMPVRESGSLTCFFLLSFFVRGWLFMITYIQVVSLWAIQN